jgi:hypothetical protein
MADPQTAAPPPCCVCAAQNGKHCAQCKSRHYCSKECQLFDWKRGHNKACKQLTKEFQDRLLDELMPAKKVKEEPAIVEDVAPAAGSRAAARLPAVQTQTTAVVRATALIDDVPDWRGTCAICLDVLPAEGDRQTFCDCCCKKICAECYVKCRQHDERCPLCRSAPSGSDAEWVRRVQKHADKGNAEAQNMLGDAYFQGGKGRGKGLQKSLKKALQLHELAAAQGHAQAQNYLGYCYDAGYGVKINYKTAAHWYRRAAEQGFPTAQYNLGAAFHSGRGVARSYDEAVKWWRLAAAQGDAQALYGLGECHANGHGVARDLHEALRLCKRAAAKGHAGAAAVVDKLLASLATARAACDAEGRFIP